MTRRRRHWRLRRLAITVAAIVAVAVLLAAASISVVPPLSVELVTLSGQPLPRAYIAYRHRGHRFNFVDSLTYSRPGTVLQADASGGFEVAGFLELHLPLDSGLTPWIEWVYVPELHHFYGPIAVGTESIPGLMENDTARGVIRLADLAEDPQRWSQTIGELDHAIRSSSPAAGDRQPHVLASKSVLDGLRAHLQEEYDAFMRRHSNTPRAMPEVRLLRSMSEAERESREREIRDAVEHEPRWGQLMERRWPELAGR